ncbi:MAG: DUF2218 domain-containing protein [Anaerolineales bacterium]|jgi:hypothetical protein|nr:DUF2218 domain-containing protein [Anaerolineales bacterium]
MIQITDIPTDRAERLMKALCNHFARKIDAKYDGDKGYIKFGDGTCEISVTTNVLTLKVEAENLENIERVKRVVVDHLLRFTPDEEIIINWQNSS